MGSITRRRARRTVRRVRRVSLGHATTGVHDCVCGSGVYLIRLQVQVLQSVLPDMQKMLYFVCLYHSCRVGHVLTELACRCTTSSDGSQSCHESCSTYQCAFSLTHPASLITPDHNLHRCNCYCCSSTSHRACSYSCPTCYNAVLDVSYTPYRGDPVQTTIGHDYGKDGSGASAFLSSHPSNSTAACYYNPKNVYEVRLYLSTPKPVLSLASH